MVLGIDDFVAACSAAEKASRMWTWLSNLKLSRREKELLATAAHDGRIQLVPFNGHFAIIANGKAIDFDDSLVQQEYLEAFERLCSRGFVRHLDDTMFRLRAAAQRKGRRFAQRGFRPASV